MIGVESIWAGFVGGCLATMMVISLYYTYVKIITRKYVQCKDLIKDRLLIRQLVDDVSYLQKVIGDLNKEFYRQYDTKASNTPTQSE